MVSYSFLFVLRGCSSVLKLSRGFLSVYGLFPCSFHLADEGRWWECGGVGRLLFVLALLVKAYFTARTGAVGLMPSTLSDAQVSAIIVDSLRSMGRSRGTTVRSVDSSFNS